MRKDKKYKLKISLVTWWYLFFYVVGLLSQSCSVYSLPISKILRHKRIIRSSECGDGTFLNTNGICEPCQVCDPNSINNTLCTKTSDALCGPCKKGYVKWDSGCLPCQYGPGLEKCEITTVRRLVQTSTDHNSYSFTSTSESPALMTQNSTTQKRTKFSRTGIEYGSIHLRVAGPVMGILAVFSIACVIAFISYCCNNNKNPKLTNTGQSRTSINYKESIPEKDCLMPASEQKEQKIQNENNPSELDNSQAFNSNVNKKSSETEFGQALLTVGKCCKVSDSMLPAKISKSMDSFINITENYPASKLSKSTSELLGIDSSHAFKLYENMYEIKQKFKQEQIMELYIKACIVGKAMEIQSIDYDIKEEIQEEIDKIPDCWRKFGNKLTKNNDYKVRCFISNYKAKHNSSFTEQLLDFSQSNGKTVEDVLVALFKCECVQRVLVKLCKHVIEISEKSS